MVGRVSAPPAAQTSRAPGAAFIFKKALISALVALVLFSLMIGVRTEAGSDGQLTYWTRFGDLAAMVAAVFGGSILIELLRQWWGPVETVRVVPAPVKSALSFARRMVAPVLLVFTFLVPVLFYDERYILDLGILVLTYVMLGWGLNVVVGLAGLLDLGYVAFYAVGAYSYALLATNFGLSFWVCLPLAGILAAFWGVLLALFTWLVSRTRLGRDMRACEQDQTMASLLGVDVDRTISMTFVIGAALAAVAGMMYLLYYGLVDFFMGFVAGIKAFTAAVLGGIGSLPGAMLGGLLIGLIETLWSAYFSVEYKDVAAFSILIVVLIFLPTGLLGRPEVEKV